MRTLQTLEKYCPEIIDEELTKSIEAEMSKIREEKKTPDAVLDLAKKTLDKTLKHFKENEAPIGEELLLAQRETQEEQATLGPCPKCHEGHLRIMYSKKTKKRFVGCSSYPDCNCTAPIPQGGMVKSTDKVCVHDEYPIIKIQMRGKRPQEICLNIECVSKRVEGAKEAILEAEEHAHKPCPKCGKDMKLRKSIYGEFWGCTGYPKCRTTEPLDGAKKKTDSKEEKKE